MKDEARVNKFLSVKNTVV